MVMRRIGRPWNGLFVRRSIWSDTKGLRPEDGLETRGLHFQKDFFGAFLWEEKKFVYLFQRVRACVYGKDI